MTQESKLMNPKEVAPFIQKVLTKKRFLDSRMFDAEEICAQILESGELEVIENFGQEQKLLYTRLSAYVWAEQKHTSTTVHFEHYATWWDHFKDRYFPKWLLAKLPVKRKAQYRTVSFERSFCYPDFVAKDCEEFKRVVIHDRISHE